ncbi:LuxR C-terminal-related transcriptional regulator [Ruminococcaceae bacterium OttesenSCG-928-O06]|nr:LuxR C-terminal-related transcriptional regulator [Ruminococcaceae bacterium OttesenSCG-928-O06]
MNRGFLPVRGNLFPRTRIYDMLYAGMGQPLITVVAGPGYGKTHVVSGFAKSLSARVVWLPFAPRDNEAQHFWHSLVQAVHWEMPELAQQLQALPPPENAAQTEHCWQVFLPHLEKGEPLVMVVDNFEHVKSVWVRHYFDELMYQMPKNSTLVLISNEKLPFGGLKPDGGQLRISMQDLAYTAQEIAQLFEARGIHLAEGQAHTLCQATAGWPMAVHTICDKGKPLEEALADKGYLQLAAELFETRYYQNYPAAMRRLLVHLSLFARFPLEIVKHIAPKDAHGTVDELAKNIFLDYDYTAKLFTWQTLYRDFLTNRQSLLDEAERCQTQRYAGDWFMENGLPGEAIEAFWRAHDYDAFLQALFRLPKGAVDAHTAEGLLDMLAHLPADYCQANPIADFARASLYINNMRLNEARELLQPMALQLEANAAMCEEKQQLLGNVYTALADIAFLKNEDTGRILLKKAAALLPDGSSLRDKQVLVVGNNSTLFLPTSRVGELKKTLEAIFAAAPDADNVYNGGGHGLESLFAAEACYYSGDMDKAREYSYQALQKARLCEQHDIICNACWVLMRICVYYGDYTKAQYFLERLVLYADNTVPQQLHLLRDSARAWFYLRVGDTKRMEDWIRQNVYPSPPTPYGLGRLNLVVAGYLEAWGEREQARAHLAQLDAAFAERGLWLARAQTHIMMAGNLLAAGDEEESARHFKQVYEMVYPNDMQMVLVEYGKTALRLIDAVGGLAAAFDYDMQWLEEVYAAAASITKRGQAMARTHAEENNLKPPRNTTLTQREKMVMEYMTQGLTREEIAQLMGISVNGVKKHMGNIYTKLGALNRADAVHIAMVQGIIGPEVQWPGA